MSRENTPDENEMEISKMFNEIRQSIQDVDSFEYQLGLVTKTEIEVKKKIHDLAKFGTHFVIAFKNEELAKSQSIPIDKLEEWITKYRRMAKEMSAMPDSIMMLMIEDVERVLVGKEIHDLVPKKQGEG